MSRAIFGILIVSALLLTGCAPDERVPTELLDYVAVNVEVPGDMTFTPVIEKTCALQKVDLSCIDKYHYSTLTPDDIDFWQQQEEAEDYGCKQYAERTLENGTQLIFMKCPLRNCEMEQVCYEEVRDVVFKEFTLRNFKASFGAENKR